MIAPLNAVTRKHRGSPLTFTFVAFSLAATPALAEPSFVGIWYSAYQPDEPGVMSLIEFRADGTFYEEFRKCDNGDYVGYQTESGTWSVVDGVERTVIDTINGDAAKVEEAHRLGLKVIPWTVSTLEAIRRVLDFGVDGLISDRPDLATNRTFIGHASFSLGRLESDG